MTDAWAAFLAKGISSLTCPNCYSLITPRLCLIGFRVGGWPRSSRRRLVGWEILLNVVESFQYFCRRRVSCLCRTNHIILVGLGRLRILNKKINLIRESFALCFDLSLGSHIFRDQKGYVLKFKLNARSAIHNSVVVHMHGLTGALRHIRSVLSHDFAKVLANAFEFFLELFQFAFCQSPCHTLDFDHRAPIREMYVRKDLEL